MDVSQPGPSGIKKRKIEPKNPSRLTDDEMAQYLDISDSDEEYQPESDDSESEEDDDVGITPMDDDIDEAERTEIAEFLATWQDEAIGMKTLDFMKTNQMLVDLPTSTEPYEYFKLLVDDTILCKIIAETNDFAESVFLRSPGNQRARISEWKHLTKEEFLIFLGLVYHMGTIKLNRLQDYWKTHRLFNLKCFSEQMSRDRFLLILRCLHFSGNPDLNESKPVDRLYKVRPLIDYFNQKMREIYYPGKNLSLDESLVLWRGRLIFRQYIANKRHKYGLKLYMLTEPTGLVLNFAVYTGQNDEMGGKGHAQKVVLHLMENNLNKGHSLYMDNFYNSCDLAQTLLDNKTYCTGTLRGDRKRNPQEVIRSKLKTGETKAKYFNGIMVGKWRDKRDVTYISTEFQNEMIEVTNRRGHIREKPIPIVEYNKYMGGIDKQDQMMSYYPSLRKTLFWYKKLGIHVLQLLLFNSYVIFCQYSGKKMTFYDFRLAVIEKLLPDVSKQPTKEKFYDHLPSRILGNQEGQRKRKRCRMCSEKKVRKDTLWECRACPENPGLCVDPCFGIFHQKKN